MISALIICFIVLCFSSLGKRLLPARYLRLARLQLEMQRLRNLDETEGTLDGINTQYCHHLSSSY